MIVFDLLFLIVGVFMVFWGIRGKNNGYITYYAGIRAYLFYRDKQPIKFQLAVYAHILGGGVVVILSFLTMLGVIER